MEDTKMEDIADEYKSSLADLHCNSKPLINMLTILADENIKYAPQIVNTIAEHVTNISSEAKLPSLYLIDSILKNVRKQYLDLFGENIVTIFASVFEKVDENTRMLLYKLRQTWGVIFPNKVLYAIDSRIKQLDPAWPITSQPPPQSIHINPKFFGATGIQKPVDSEENKLKAQQNEALKQLFAKQEQLRLLEQKKREFASKQLLHKDTSLVAAEAKPPSEANIPDPRIIAAKMNPNLTQRDPRLQKVMVVSALKTNAAETKSNAQENKKIIPSSDPSPALTASPVVTTSIGTERLSADCGPGGKRLRDRSDDSTASQNVKNDKGQSSKVTEKPKNVNLHEKGGLVVSSKQSEANKEKGTGRKKKTTNVREPLRISPRTASKHSLKKESPPKKRPCRKSPSKNAQKNSDKDERPLENKKDGDTCKPTEKLMPEAVSIKKEVKDEPFSSDELTANVKRQLEDREKKSFNEPPVKKMKEEPVDIPEDDSFLGQEDQDYRQLLPNNTEVHKGWATYKAAHPDEFKKPEHQLAQSKEPESPEFVEGKKIEEKIDHPFSSFQNRQLAECDKLGRPRLPKSPRFNRTGFSSAFQERKSGLENRRPSADKYYQDVILSSVMSDPKDVIRQAEERYRLGRISESAFNDIRCHLEKMRDSEEYRRFQTQHNSSWQTQFANEPDGLYLNPNGKNMVDSHFHSRSNEHSSSGCLVPPSEVKTFRLDNKSRVIHFVNDQAIVLTDNDEPRELTFRGEPKQVYISGMKPITLRFDGKPVEFELNGNIHYMKFGAPSRELYINNRPYEGKFGGPSFNVTLCGKVHKVSLGGPLPQVQVSEHPAHELYQKFLALNRQFKSMPPRGAYPHPADVLQEGDVDMRANPMQNSGDTDLRHERHPDAGSEFSNNGRKHMPYQGEPVPFVDNKLRQINQRDQGQHPEQQGWEMTHYMPDFRSYPPEQSPDEWRPTHPVHFYDRRKAGSPHGVPQSQEMPPLEWKHTSNKPDGPPPVFQQKPHWRQNRRGGMAPQQTTVSYNSPHPQERFPDPSNFPMPPRPNLNPAPIRSEIPRPPIFAGLPRPPLPPWMKPVRPGGPPDVVMSSVLLPPPPRPPMHMHVPDAFMKPTPLPIETPALSSTTVVEQHLPDASLKQETNATVASTVPVQEAAPTLALDVNTLFSKLLAAGIISKAKEPNPDSDLPSAEEEEDKGESAVEKDPNDEPIPSILLKIECLKMSYSGIISCLYRGSQCASCGMRFKEIQGERYSRHLDWHFRVNRREKDGVKKAFSRKWYYEIEDWIQFEEFDDIEERGRSFFDIEADERFQLEENVEVPSVPVSGQETEACVVCQEPFQLFWVEEEEEWHLRNAVRHDEQAYHPSCYEDFKKATAAPVKDPDIKQEPTEMEIKQESSEVEIKQEPSEVEIKQEAMEEEMDSEEALLHLGDAEEVVRYLIEEIVKEDEVPELEIKEEVVETAPQEEMELQGKPGEEEIIGVITEGDVENEDSPVDESEKVVFQSGGIVMKVRPESLKTLSPLPETVVKQDDEAEEEFRPPTPDPRFQVLPPVKKGSQLSGFCSIM